MTTTLKQFQGSFVDPKDDAKVYQFLGGVSGIVAGCAVTLYATNQLKVSEGWGFACGRVFAIEEEVVVATTTAAKGRIIVNIDLENIAEPASLTTQSAAALPALVQENLNKDGTVFQLALAQYDIASNTISNLIDVRAMLYDIDSRINAKVDLGETSSTAYRGDRGKVAYDHSQTTGNPHGTTKANISLGNVDNTSDANKPVSTATQTALNAKQDKITNTANRLFYGSGTPGALNQIAHPSADGSFLRQDASGAPYWSTPNDLHDMLFDVSTASLASVGGATSGNSVLSSAFRLAEDSHRVIFVVTTGAITSDGSRVARPFVFNAGYRPHLDIFIPCRINVLASGAQWVAACAYISASNGNISVVCPAASTTYGNGSYGGVQIGGEFTIGN